MGEFWATASFFNHIIKLPEKSQSYAVYYHGCDMAVGTEPRVFDREK